MDLGKRDYGYEEQVPQLVEAAKQQNNSGWKQDKRRFAERVAAGKATPQHPLEHQAYNTLQTQLKAATGRYPTKADLRAHFGVETNAEVKSAIRRHVGLE